MVASPSAVGATKRCRKCGEVKSTAEFHRCRDNNDGLQGQCKDCRRVYIPPQTAKPGLKRCGVCEKTLPASQFGLFTRIFDRLHWYCKECGKKRMRNWMVSNMDKIKARYANSPGIGVGIGRGYPLRHQNQQPSWLSQEQLDQLLHIHIEKWGRNNSTGLQHHVDHIVPLKGKLVSGLHVPWNLRVITAAENMAKGNRV